MLPDIKTLLRLDSCRSGWAQEMQVLELYMRGEQPLRFMTDAMRKEFGDKITPLVLNWPEVVTDAHVDRCDVEGFRLGSSSSGDDDLWGVWQANDLDAASVMGHTDAVALGRAAIVVGAGEGPDDPPLVTVESAKSMGWLRDARTGKVTIADRRWDDEDFTRWRTIFTTTSQTTLRMVDGDWAVDREATFDELPYVPVVPLVNRPGLSTPNGRSELLPILPVADAANKVATDMMQSAEYHAMPRRWISGMKVSDFKDAAGNMFSPFRALKNHVWVTEEESAKFGQFDESSLSNFHETIKLLAHLVAQLAALPPDYMTFTTANPTSADALRAAESRLIKRIERKHVYFGDAWERAMRLALAFRGRPLGGSERLETVWRSPATPTVAQKADATVKLLQTRDPRGRSVVPLEQARIDLGYTPEQRAEMARMDLEAESSDPLTASVQALMTNGVAAPSAG